MPTYFIIKDGDPRQVWNFHRRDWCYDVDAAYGNGFEYASRESAEARRKDLAQYTAGRGYTSRPLWNGITVVTRDQLFAMLEVRDWAGRSR